MRSNLETQNAARQLRAMWNNKVWADEPLGPNWDSTFANWIQKFGYERVADAVQTASVPCYAEDGKRLLPPDIHNVPKHAAVEWAEDREPGMKACHLARGRMRQKFFCEKNDNEVLKLLVRAMRAGVSASAMNDAIDSSFTLEDCFVAMGVDRVEFRIAMGHPILDSRPKGQIFIPMEHSEWQIWDSYLRRTTGKGAQISKRGGSYFPSRLPPADPALKKGKR